MKRNQSVLITGSTRSSWEPDAVIMNNFDPCVTWKGKQKERERESARERGLGWGGGMGRVMLAGALG